MSLPCFRSTSHFLVQEGSNRVPRCGEIIDCNLIRDKATGKSKGFAFIAFEDQRSTVLAVDNMNGIKACEKVSSFLLVSYEK